jgi:hypothetical protein
MITAGRHKGATQNASASAGPNKGSGGASFARRAAHRDAATEADDVVEFQLLGQHPVELLIAMSTGSGEGVMAWSAILFEAH